VRVVQHTKFTLRTPKEGRNNARAYTQSVTIIRERKGGGETCVFLKVARKIIIVLLQGEGLPYSF